MNKVNYKKILSILILAGILFSLLLYFFRINKFVYTGDLLYIDQRILKILSLNLLKDQPIFWFNKNEFSIRLKSELPQIKEISFKILNSDTISIDIQAENICCVVKDSSEKNLVVSNLGLVLREFNGNFKSSIDVNSPNTLNLNDSLNKSLIEIIQKIQNQNIKIDFVKDNKYFIDRDSVYFYSLDSKQILINEDTDFKKINENYKNIKSYLEQNQKNYSILDFRFEKIVVK